MSDDNKKQLDPEAIKAVVSAVLAGFNEAGKGGPSVGGTDMSNLPEQLTDAIATALDNAGQGEEAASLREQAASGLDEAREQARQDAAKAKQAQPEADPLGDEVKAAFGKFIADKGDGRTPDELIVDEKFLAENGSELAGRMLGAFAKALLPDAPMEMDVNAGDASDPDKKVKVKLDLGKLIAGFVKPLAEGPGDAEVEASVETKVETPPQGDQTDE